MADDQSWNDGKTEGTFINSNGTGENYAPDNKIDQKQQNPIILDGSLVTLYAIESKVAKADHLSRYSQKAIKDAIRHLKSYTEGIPDEKFIQIYRNSLNHIFKEE